MTRTANKRLILSLKSSRLARNSFRTSTHSRVTTDLQHQAFWPLVGLTFLVWIVYRSVFNFPVWFDESIGKALFFGIPVWLYISITGLRAIPDTFAVSKFKSGILLGIAVGGILSFAATIFTFYKGGVTVQIQPVALYSSPEFWGQFLLAMMTAFWETLFFFSWIMVVIQEKMKDWPLAKQLVAVAGIFTIFHIPNALLRFDMQNLASFTFLMFVFALGQGLLFVYRRNAYALIFSHALWGMVLLLHF